MKGTILFAKDTLRRAAWDLAANAATQVLDGERELRFFALSLQAREKGGARRVSMPVSVTSRRRLGVWQVPCTTGERAAAMQRASATKPFFLARTRKRASPHGLSMSATVPIFSTRKP